MASNFWTSPHAAELVSRSAVLDAHSQERALGLGDGDIDEFKAVVVEYIFEVARHSGGALRQRVVATAATYARRHLHRRGLSTLQPLHLALAALFLASKVEESHVSADYLLASAARAAAAAATAAAAAASASASGNKIESDDSNRKGEAGGRNCVVSIVASSSSSAAGQQTRRRPTTTSKPSSLRPPPPLPAPKIRQLLAAEAELLSSLGSRGLLLFSPYPDALEAAAAIEKERERMTNAEMEKKTKAKGSNDNNDSEKLDHLGSHERDPRLPRTRKDRERQQSDRQRQRARQLRLGARAWASVSCSLARTDLCLWCPPHVLGFASAAVAAAAADAELEAAEAAEEEEEEEERDDEEMEGQGDDEDEDDDKVIPSVSFSDAAASWFSSVDVDLAQIADVAAEICHAVGVERARGGATTNGGGSGGGAATAARRADAAARVFALLRTKALQQL